MSLKDTVEILMEVGTIRPCGRLDVPLHRRDSQSAGLGLDDVITGPDTDQIRSAEENSEDGDGGQDCNKVWDHTHLFLSNLFKSEEEGVLIESPYVCRWMEK